MGQKNLGQIKCLSNFAGSHSALLSRGSLGARLRGRGRGSAGVRLRDMGRGNHAITALKVIKRNQVKMIKKS